MLEKYRLYKGKVILTFDSIKHIYRVDGEIKRGATNIINVLSKPQLIRWAVRLTKEKVSSELKRLGNEEFLKNLPEIITIASKEHEVVSKEARELGTRVHKKAERWLTKGTDQDALIIEMMQIANKKERLACTAMFKFFKKYKFKPIALEGKCYSKEHGYAGTIDFYGDVDGKLTVLDYKTSTGIYSGYPLQSTAYAWAKHEEGYKVDQTMIARFGKNGVLEVLIEKDWKKHFPAFLAAQTLKEYEVSLTKGRSKNNFKKKKL